ncbi:MAG: TIM barrel protein [Candidatus ainarchaeum sp.]|nr:TIM barrel protein [Candidatus ainarchaeum sp.]
MVIRYGTSGNPPNFYKSEFRKDIMNAPEWINSIGLNAYERLMTYGARMKEEKAVELGKKANMLDVQLTIHAPYYIVLTSEKERVIINSIRECLKTTKLASLMGAKKIVLHPGFGNNLEKFVKNIRLVEKNLEKKVTICPETMGKISQLGSVEEIVSICEQTECEPCIDFGHVHAKEQGSLKDEKRYREILELIEKRLGKKSLNNLHCHFYPVEFTEKGEKVHRAVTEKKFFPKFKQLAPLIKEFNMKPTLISESKDSQDIGALEMQRIMKN